MSAVEVLTPLDPLAQIDQEHTDALPAPDAATEVSAMAMEPCHNMITKEDTMIIFDWDDTLVPTTFLFSNQPGSLTESFEMPQKLQESLDNCAVSALATLEMAKQFGHVCIVTNSQNGWIDLATERFFPRLTEVLRDIPKFSARSAFESPTLVQPVHWKALAFEHCVNSFYGSSPRIRNVVSLGDSEHDRAALFMAAQKVPGIWAKSLKLTEQPDAEYIVKELELIRESLQTLTNHPGALDLCIQCHARTPPGLEGNHPYAAPPGAYIDANGNIVAPPQQHTVAPSQERFTQFQQEQMESPHQEFHGDPKQHA